MPYSNNVGEEKFWQIIRNLPKLKPSKLIATINNLLADLFFTTLFSLKCSSINLCQTLPTTDLLTI